MDNRLSINPIDENGAGRLYEHMKRDFPRGELPPFFAVKGNIKKKVYSAFYFVDGDKNVGYAILVAPPDNGFVLINFFAIMPEFRACGYGRECIRFMCKIYPERTPVLEIEDPAKSDSELRLRRQRFYEREGFRVIPTKKARIFGVDMQIMSTGELGSVREVMHSLYRPTFGLARWLKNIDVEDERSGIMKFKMAHTNLNVLDLDKSIEFYNKALGLTVARKKARESFTNAFLTDGSAYELELTCLHDRKEPYELGDNETHLCFSVDDYNAAYELHKEMGCICYENTAMELYFIEDPDGYWLEILSADRND